MKKNKINMTIWWLFWIIYLEMVYRIFIVQEFFNLNTLSVILFSIPWALLLSVITSIFNNKINRILNIFLTFFITLFTIAQIVYFKFYHSIFSFFSLTTGTGQVMQFWTQILEVILHNWYIILLIVIPAILVLIFSKKIFNYKRLKLKNIFIHLIIIFYH